MFNLFDFTGNNQPAQSQPDYSNVIINNEDFLVEHPEWIGKTYGEYNQYCLEQRVKARIAEKEHNKKLESAHICEKCGWDGLLDRENNTCICGHPISFEQRELLKEIALDNAIIDACPEDRRFVEDENGGIILPGMAPIKY